jgi:hypothetical protein
MNSYKVIRTNLLYNDVIAHIIAISISQAISMALAININFYDNNIEIILERTNVVDQKGTPYPASITIY